jgi:TolB-like protein
MKKLCLVFAFFSFIIAGAFGTSTKMAVSDFVVHSENPKYKFMGKGISEMIAVELRKSPKITLVERDKRTELLEEMEIALSDMADPEVQLEVGKLLAADYILFGEIIDLDTQILISLRMIDVETGEVVWNEKLTAKLSKYDYITGYFTKAILDNFDMKASQSTVVKAAKEEEKDEEAVVSFSKAIDYYDKKEKQSAKKELAQAKRIDPSSEAVKIYLQKLEGVSPKFRVELERHASTYNPASLGMLKQDEASVWSSMPITGLSEEDTPAYGDGFSGHEVSISSKMGYALPIGTRIGLAAEFIFAHQDNSINSPSAFDFLGTSVSHIAAAPTNVGGSLGIGYRFLNDFSLGASFHYYNVGNLLSNLESAGDIIGGNYLSFNLGFLVQSLQERLLFDLQAVYTTQKEYYLYQDEMKVLEGNLPLILEGTITGAFFERTLFPAIKGIGEIYFDQRRGYFLRLIPVVEYWPFPFLALRAGYENAHINQADRFLMGHGFLAGLTLKFWKFTLSANYTNRIKPLHILPGYQFQQSYILWGLTFNPGLLSRKE